jgi:DNA-binding response OmpR family regulator
MKANILIIEDDERLGRLLEQELKHAGYQSHLAQTGNEGMFLAENGHFDLIVLDLNLPDMDGLEVAEQLRKTESSILMLTARGDVESRVQGLYAGASDYMTKPFSTQELLARIHVRLRERGPKSSEFSYGPMSLDSESSSLKVNEQLFILPELEFKLLYLLLSNPKRLFSKEALEQQLYGAALPGSNTIEVFIYNLRKRIRDAGGDDVIKTVRNKGYMVR